MFTGIIQKTATVVSRQPTGEKSYRLVLSNSYRSEAPRDPLVLGESIAINGVCLTVVAFSPERIEFDVSPETVERTSLSRCTVGKRVNLERALRMGDRLSGHWVQGHVDGTARISRIETAETGYINLDVEFPEGDLPRYCVHKGSICLDGISLTIHRLIGRTAGFQIIPHTWNETSLPELVTGDLVNIEVDILAKYLERMKVYEQA